MGHFPITNCRRHLSASLLWSLLEACWKPQKIIWMKNLHMGSISLKMKLKFEIFNELKDLTQLEENLYSQLKELNHLNFIFNFVTKKDAHSLVAHGCSLYRCSVFSLARIHNPLLDESCGWVASKKCHGQVPTKKFRQQLVNWKMAHKLWMNWFINI